MVLLIAIVIVTAAAVARIIWRLDDNTLVPAPYDSTPTSAINHGLQIRVRKLLIVIKHKFLYKKKKMTNIGL